MLAKDESQIAYKKLCVRADVKPRRETGRVACEEKGVSRQTRKWLLWLLVLMHDRILNLLRTVGVALKVFAKARGEVPDADQEERQDGGAARPAIEDMPEMRPQHRDEEGREKERDGGKDRLRARVGLA